MDIKRISGDFTVCKVADFSGVKLEAEYCFIGKTARENSLVCRTEDVPANVAEREDGWRAFRIEGTLDFSLVGILADLSARLTEAGVSLFALSTYDTDTILVKRENEPRALDALGRAGYRILTE